MSAAEAQKLAEEVLSVRRSHPHAPALDVLDLVMKCRHQLPDFGDLALPPAHSRWLSPRRSTAA